MKEKISDLIARTDVSQFIAIEQPELDYTKIKSDIIEKTSEKEKHKPKRRMYVYSFAAAIMLLIVSIPVIALLTKSAVVYDNPEYSVVSGTVTEKTALENIRLKKLYGEVSLTSRSKEELENSLTRFQDGSMVYEDDSYIYNFSVHGRLIEVYPLNFRREYTHNATEQEVRENALSLLEMYYPNEYNDYAMNQIRNPDRYSQWEIIFTRKAVDNTTMRVFMDFDIDGKLRGLLSVGSEESIGKKSRKDIINIAFDMLQSEQYDYLTFDKETLVITVDAEQSGGKQYYSVSLENLKVEHKSFDGYQFIFNADTGDLTKAHEFKSVRLIDVDGNAVSYHY